MQTITPRCADGCWPGQPRFSSRFRGSCGVVAGPDASAGAVLGAASAGARRVHCRRSTGSTRGTRAPDRTRRRPPPPPRRRRRGRARPAPKSAAPPVLVTGDMLVHAQLWEQARADALATGAKGLDFEPLLAGQRKYIGKSDLAVCHQETPRVRTDRPVLRLPVVQRTAADHHAPPSRSATTRAPPPATTPFDHGTARAGDPRRPRRGRTAAHRLLSQRSRLPRRDDPGDRRRERRRDRGRLRFERAGPGARRGRWTCSIPPR